MERCEFQAILIDAGNTDTFRHTKAHKSPQKPTKHTKAHKSPQKPTKAHTKIHTKHTHAPRNIQSHKKRLYSIASHPKLVRPRSLWVHVVFFGKTLRIIDISYRLTMVDTPHRQRLTISHRFTIVDTPHRQRLTKSHRFTIVDTPHRQRLTKSTGSP